MVEGDSRPMRTRFFQLAAAALLLFIATSALAQTDLARGTNEVSLWGGFSPNSPRNIGVTGDRKLFLLNVQYDRVLFTTRNIAWKYMGEVVPVAIITQHPEVIQLGGGATASVGTDKIVYGAGFSPLGAQMNFRRKAEVQPFLNAQGGLLYFADQVPVVNSSQFNFTFSFGAGVQIFRNNRSALTIGYKYHHISNDETAPRNPGVDSNLFYMGYSWLWRKK
jgi:opacity protein-like surface antigen